MEEIDNQILKNSAAKKPTNDVIENIASNVVPHMIAARQKTWVALEAIRKIITPGMTEKQAIQKSNQYLASIGVRKFWHQTHVRFGKSTVLGFNDPYLENVILKENDIFYIDLGPIWDDVEGDCGDTFVVGHNTEFVQIQKDVKKLFLQAQEFWKVNQSTGKEIFDFVSQEAQKLGYLMKPDYVKGHRLSEFSHQKYSNTCLFDVDFHPSAERWILELQICHATMQFGAFYEDILLS